MESKQFRRSQFFKWWYSMRKTGFYLIFLFFLIFPEHNPIPNNEQNHLRTCQQHRDFDYSFANPPQNRGNMDQPKR
jgi:hypothetical protein